MQATQAAAQRSLSRVRVHLGALAALASPAGQQRVRAPCLAPHRLDCRKVGKAYFALLDVLCHNHANVIATRDTGALAARPWLLCAGCYAWAHAGLPAAAVAGGAFGCFGCMG